MGACTFHNVVRRGTFPDGLESKREGQFLVHRQKYTDWPNAREAFQQLVADSQYEHGHSYSGEIGMKHDFVHIATVDTIEEAHKLADKLIEDRDPRINDKGGPAGCITIREGEYQFLFFGWASS